MLRGAQDPDAPAAVLDHRKDVYLRAVDQVSGEEVQRQDPLRLRSQELRPAGAVQARSRVDPGILEDLPHRRWRHDDAEPGKLTVDPPALLRCAFPEQRRSTIGRLCWVQMVSARLSNATRSLWRLGTSVAMS